MNHLINKVVAQDGLTALKVTVIDMKIEVGSCILKLTCQKIISFVSFER